MLPQCDRIAVLGLALALGPVGVSAGQEPARPTAAPTQSNPATPAAGHSIHGEAFNDGPRRRASLMKDMGKVDFPVTADNAEARAFINQGVAQLHSFSYFEAERSFRQAAMLDPACPMSYWGMAMANVNSPGRARGFLKEARARAASAKLTRREQLYLDALEALTRDGGDDRSKKKEHLLGLEAIVREFPEDREARAWMAMVTWQNAASDGIGSRQAVDMVLESVLDREPLHPGAHHYRIHLWDHVKVANAEKAAALYARSAPGIAHAWHMPGHTYTELKRYADAAYQQEGSARVDHAYMIRDRVMPFEIHNYAHNNQWLATSLGHVGRAGDAITVARNLVEQPRDPQKNGPNDGGSPQRVGRLRWAEALIRFELWDDLIAATESGALDWTEIPAEKIEKARSLGLAYAARGDAAKLAGQVAALKAVGGGDPPKPATPPAKPATTPSGPSAPAIAELEGHQALAKGEALAALESFARATQMNPEALARAHLAGRNYGFAEAAARKAVDRQPSQFVPLATLVEALHASNKDEEARDAYRKLEPMARLADKETPIARRVAAIVEGWKAQGRWSAPAADPPTDEALAARVDLGPLGPLGWSPSPAAPIATADADGKPWSLADHKGRNVVVLFYLGGKCAHCMQQLQEFGKQFKAFEAAGTDVVAIGTDTPEEARALKANADAIRFPMPLLPDPSMAIFRAYQAFDDFEGRPLHAAFLVDKRGDVRFQRISADPFLDVEFLKGEAARVGRMVK